MNSAVNHIGGLFITSFAESRPTDSFLRFLAESRPAGVILFAEHCGDHSQLAQTISNIQSALDGKGLIAIDQEGGRVCRVTGHPAEFSSAESYGNQALKSGSIQESLKTYRSDLSASLRYLRDLGFTFWLGPVCDLHLYNEETALDTRTFGSDPELVGEFVDLSVDVCHENGFACCLKHAPGLGRVNSDPHFHLGVSSVTENEFLASDANPFVSGIRAGADAIMTSHFMLPNFDEYPVTFSQAIVKQLIRTHLSNSLPVITDDLQMGALKEMGSQGELAARALTAGHDLLLTRNQSAVLSGIAEIERRINLEPALIQRVKTALRNIHKLKNRSTALKTLN